MMGPWAFLVVGLGGALGSMLRYAIGLAFLEAKYPVATLLVNVSGCFLIGLALPAWGREPWFGPDLRLLLIVGFLGGFTTFSAFGYEAAALLEVSVGRGVLHVLANVLLGLGAVTAGRALAIRLFLS